MLSRTYSDVPTVQPGESQPTIGVGAATSEDAPVVTEGSYKSDDVEIVIEKIQTRTLIYFVAEVKLSDVKQLQAAFAQNRYGRHITDTTSLIASQQKGAIFAVNGDYYGFRDEGLVIRNGVFFRDSAREAPDNTALIFTANGDMQAVTEGEVDGRQLVGHGVWQGFTFGPLLVQDSAVVENIETTIAQKANPRTAVGQIAPLHYIFIVADGRSNVSDGLTLEQLAQLFADRGCTIAYNLDGGGSSTMWFNGEIVNHPSYNNGASEREISDIIYIAG